MNKLRLLTCLALLAAPTTGCTRNVIPNTDVEDTARNREVVDFVEEYRLAVEARKVPALLQLASEDYFDDMGTPNGDDDVDYKGLKGWLVEIHDEIPPSEYVMKYHAITFTPNDLVLVEVNYTSTFVVEAPDGPSWRRHGQEHRLALRLEGDVYKIVSGM